MSLNDEFRKFLEELSATTERTSFRPDAHMNTTGDMIEIYFEPVPYVAEWVNHRLAIYRAIDDNRIVGCEVVSIKAASEGRGPWDAD